MSRIGNTPIVLKDGAVVSISSTDVRVKGPKGELGLQIPHGITVTAEADTIRIRQESKDPKAKALHGLTRAIIANHVTGVTKGWTKILELSGVGYRATTEGTMLVLTVGFSHQVKISPPPGISFSIQDGKIVVSGIDRQVVGQAAADIRSVKPPEPYKGKGIKYVGERIRKKAGKAKAVGGSGGAK